MTREELAPAGKVWIRNVHFSQLYYASPEDLANDDWPKRTAWEDVEVVPVAVSKAGRQIDWARALYGRRVKEESDG